MSRRNFTSDYRTGRDEEAAMSLAVASVLLALLNLTSATGGPRGSWHDVSGYRGLERLCPSWSYVRYLSLPLDVGGEGRGHAGVRTRATRGWLSGLASAVRSAGESRLDHGVGTRAGVKTSAKSRANRSKSRGSWPLSARTFLVVRSAKPCSNPASSSP